MRPSTFSGPCMWTGNGGTVSVGVSEQVAALHEAPHPVDERLAPAQGVGELLGRPRPVEEVDQVRGHLVAVLGDHRAHPAQVGLERDDAPRTPRTGRSQVRRALDQVAVERAREPAHGLLGDAADLRIHGDVAEVGRPRDPQPPPRASSAASQSTSSHGMLCRSRWSGRAITVIISAASSTVRAIGPMCSSDSQLEIPGYRSSRHPGYSGTPAHRGLEADETAVRGGDADRPAPVAAEGEGQTPAATAAPEPALDPPGVIRRSHGLRMVSWTGLCPTPL